MVGKHWHHLEHHLARPRPDADSSVLASTSSRHQTLCLHPVHFLLPRFSICFRSPSLSSRALHFVGITASVSCHGLQFASRGRPDVAPSRIRFTFILPDLVSSGNHRHLNSNCPVLRRTLLHAIAVVALQSFFVFDPVLRRRPRGLRHNKETSPALVRLCLRRDVKAIQQYLPQMQRVKINALKILSDHTHSFAPSLHPGFTRPIRNLLDSPLLHSFTRDQRPLRAKKTQLHQETLRVGRRSLAIHQLFHHLRLWKLEDLLHRASLETLRTSIICFTRRC